MRKPLRIAVFSGCGLLLAALLVLLLLWRASRQVPEFYREAIRDEPAAQAEASDEMIHRATALASDVEHEGRWQATFTAEQINGWLAVDLVENHPNQLPPAVSDPRVAIEPDRLLLACRFRQGRFDTVLSLELDAYLAEPNVVAVRIGAARAGSLPMPLEGVVERISQAIEGARLRTQWRQADGDPVAMISIPPQSNRQGKRVEIDSFRLGDGEVHVAGRTF